MGNESGSSAGGGIAALGILLIVVGVILYIYPEETTAFGYTVYTEYPYREIGQLLLILGIVVAVIGGIVAALASSVSSSPEQQVHQHYYQQPPPPQQQPQQKYCQSCGRSIPSDGVLCPYCGQNVGR